jgi:hypothetical protein
LSGIQMRDQTRRLGVVSKITLRASQVMPGSRIDAATWIDTSGNIWLFGAGGLDDAGP